MRLRITERLEKRTRTRRRYDGATEPKTYFVAIGRLRITIDEARQFEDTADQKLESLLNDFFVAAYNSVVRCWRQTREREAWNREWAEQ